MRNNYLIAYKTCLGRTDVEIVQANNQAQAIELFGKRNPTCLILAITLLEN